MIKHYYDKADKAHWHALRDKISGLNDIDVCRFGASSVSSVLGLNKYSPKMKVFYNALGQHLDKIYTESLANGLLIEAFIKQRYQMYSPNEEEMVDNMLNNRLVNRLDDVDYILTNDKYPHLFASLDFVKPKGEVVFHTGEVLEHDAPVDTKNTKYQTFKNWCDVLPIYYQVQAQVQMMLLESDYAEMSVFVEGEKLVVFPVYKDASLQDRIVNESGEFALSILKAKQVQKCVNDSKSQEDREMYMEVLQSLEPSIDYTDSQTELLYDQWSEPDGNIMKGNKASDLWARRYLKCNEIISLADKYKTFSKNQLLNYIKEANGALSDEFKVTRVAKNLKPLFKVQKNK